MIQLKHSIRANELLFNSACDDDDLLDIFDDREMYKICNTFYGDFGELVVNFYNDLVIPNSEQIDLDGTFW